MATLMKFTVYLGFINHRWVLNKCEDGSENGREDGAQ